METMTDSPRIYVASLSDYNAGRLHGVWIDADQDADDIQEAISAMLARSPQPGAEEYAIHDYEGFHDLKIGEYESIETVAELAQLIQEHGPAFAAFAAYEGLDYATPDRFEDAYAGEWASVEEYAQELAEETMSHEARQMSESWPFTCIDWEHAARELVIGGDIWTADAGGGSIYVFRSI